MLMQFNLSSLAMMYNVHFNLKPGFDVEVLGKRAMKTPFSKILINPLNASVALI